MRYRMNFPALALIFTLLIMASVTANSFLIWNPSEQTQAVEMDSLLVEQGYTGVITADITNYLENLDLYKPLIFFVGRDDEQLQQTLVDIQDAIGDYLEAGGALYWDGLYSAYFNDYYRDQIFGFDIATCNTEPFTTIYGTSQSFETLTMATESTIAPMIGGGDGCAFAAIDICPDKAVFRDGQYRAMLTAFDFGCLTDSGPNSRIDYLTAVMDWLAGPVDVPEDANALPDKIGYIEAYPNPFNVQTRIDFSVLEPARISIRIYNLLGQPVETLFEGRVNAGQQSIYWDASTYSTGIYFARLEAVSYSECAKLILLK